MWFKRERIYLDYAGATPLCGEALRAMREAERFYGNPGAIHSDATAAKRMLEEARERIAAELAVKPRELIFTSGLTESNNLAILGRAKKIREEKGSLSGTHWVVSSIEHSSVLGCFAEIEKEGGDVSFVDPDRRGRIQPYVLARKLKQHTVFVSVGWANAEVGVVQPLSQLSQVIRALEKQEGTTILFHSDAGQAPLYFVPSAHTLGVDLFSIGSGKLYGPRGIGALYVGSRAELSPILVGGGQERGLRSGTEEVSLAAGFSAAIEEMHRVRKTERERLARLQKMFTDELRKRIPGVIVNSDTSGDAKHCLPNVVNVSVPSVQSEYFVLALDQSGISLSTKSACAEGSSPASHVVARMLEAEHTEGKKEDWRPTNTLRFSLGRHTSKRELVRALERIERVYREVQLH